MSALIRDAPFGQIIRYFTNNRVLQYPEERPDFQIPAAYMRATRPLPKRLSTSSTAAPTEGPATEEVVYPDPETVLEKDDNTSEDENDLEKIQTARTQYTTHTQISRVGTRTALQKSISRADLEQQFSLASVERGPSRPIEPEQLDDGTILVDWYATDDPSNPQNWAFGKKAIVLAQILMYTMGVYMGSAIYSPSIPGVMERFGVEIGAASLGLSMYVLAYGIGPLLFSPLRHMSSATPSSSFCSCPLRSWTTSLASSCCASSRASSAARVSRPAAQHCRTYTASSSCPTCCLFGPSQQHAAPL
jgi:DHA1 family multidrug resistance protein-like MFS transporter